MVKVRFLGQQDQIVEIRMTASEAVILKSLAGSCSPPVVDTPDVIAEIYRGLDKIFSNNRRVFGDSIKYQSVIADPPQFTKQICEEWEIKSSPYQPPSPPTSRPATIDGRTSDQIRGRIDRVDPTRPSPPEPERHPDSFTIDGVSDVITRARDWSRIIFCPSCGTATIHQLIVEPRMRYMRCTACPNRIMIPDF